MPSASALAKISRSRLVDWSAPAAPPMDGSKSSVTSTRVPSPGAKAGTGVPVRPVWVMPNGPAIRSCTSSTQDRPVTCSMMSAEDDVVGVRVVVRSARLAEPSGRFGDGDLLGRRPLPLGLGPSRGLIEVLAEPAGVVEELAGRDPVRPRQVGDVAVDAGVEVDAALVGELQHDDGDERLGGAADVPRHVGIDGPARRVERRCAATRLGDRAVGVAHRDAGTDELTRGLVLGEDGRQLRLARRIDRDGRRGCGRLRCRGRRWCRGGGRRRRGRRRRRVGTRRRCRRGVRVWRRARLGDRLRCCAAAVVVG